MKFSFEWYKHKEQENLKNHKISFDEAITVFNDPSSITIDDADHSKDEYRFIDIGISANGQILILVYTERQEKVRIISCRRATSKERRIYEESNT